VQSLAPPAHGSRSCRRSQQAELVTVEGPPGQNIPVEVAGAATPSAVGRGRCCCFSSSSSTSSSSCRLDRSSARKGDPPPGPFQGHLQALFQASAPSAVRWAGTSSASRARALARAAGAPCTDSALRQSAPSLPARRAVWSASPEPSPTPHLHRTQGEAFFELCARSAR
jgi:hypothetical protein